MARWAEFIEDSPANSRILIDLDQIETVRECKRFDPATRTYNEHERTLIT